MEIRVSIIIATYNSVETIRRALDSVLNQTFQDWECIVVDGASKDDTISIVREFEKKDSRFRHISEPDNGVYDAFNKGWKMAKGEWIYYLGSDDILTENGMLELVKGCSEDVDVVSGHCYTEKADGTISECYSNGIDGCHQGKIMRVSTLAAFNGFDLSYKILADFDLMERLKSAQVKARTIDTFVAYFSMAGMSQSMEGSWERYKERLNIYKKHQSYCVAVRRSLYREMHLVASVIYRKLRKYVCR